jgi:hypothetical protein
MTPDHDNPDIICRACEAGTAYEPDAVLDPEDRHDCPGEQFHFRTGDR